MNKFFVMLLSVVALSCGSLSAQNLAYEVTAGMNYAGLSNLDNRIGFHAGIRAEIGLPSVAEGLYANAGALLSLKGGRKDAATATDADANFTEDAYFVDIPLHLGYKFQATPSTSFFAEVGPYIGIGCFGKAKYNEAVKDAIFGQFGIDDAINTFDSLKGLDAGVGGRVGMIIGGGLSVSVGYDLGLVDLSKEHDLQSDIKNFFDKVNEAQGSGDSLHDFLSKGIKSRNLMVSVGYRF